MKLLKKLPVAALLAAGLSCAHAAADFTTIRATSITLNDATPTQVVTFTLPSNVNTSSSTANSAVLDLEAQGVASNYNEVYINPPTTVCTDNATDANQAGSVGMLREHDDAHMQTESATNHFVFSSSRLLPGTNTVLFCVRSSAGLAGPDAGNVDDVYVRNVVLHYHTTEPIPPRNPNQPPPYEP